MVTISSSTPLGQGLRALAAGQLSVAETLLQQAWEQAVEPAEAAAALGQLAARREDWATAEAWFMRSLKVRAAQYKVWFALAQMQDVQGRAGEAVQAFAEAARLAPDWAPAHYELARSGRELGLRKPALAAAQRAVQLRPADGNGWQLLAMLQEESDDLPAALQSVDRALQLLPDRASLHHNRGVVLHRLALLPEALEAHRRALDLGLNVADAHYNTGNTLLALGDVAEARQAYGRALKLDPLHALTLHDFAKMRWAQGDQDFDAHLLAAAAEHANSDVPQGLLGLMWLKAGRARQSELAFRRAIEMAPARAAYFDGLGQAQSQLGRHDDAREAHLRAVQLAPEDVAVLGNAALGLFAGGFTSEGLSLAERAWQLAPNDQHAIALVGLGWRLHADPRDTWLHEPARVLGAVDIEAPPGWPDIQSFNAELARELAGCHSDAQAPIDQTLRHGTQTRGNVFDLGLPLVTLLREQLGRAISAWLASLTEDAEHPFLGRNTGRWKFSDSWSSRLRSSGFHTNHVHSHGWLSCCYYIQAPESVLQSPTHAGWIKFGEPDLPGNARVALPPRQYFAPMPGRLALFPSYYWHGTEPFEDAEHRLTIAFDVLPA